MGIVIKKNLGRRVADISIKLGIPKSTVEAVIKEYISSLKADGKRGERVNVDGLVSITMVRDLDTGEIVPRGRVSPAFKSALASVNLPTSFED